MNGRNHTTVKNCHIGKLVIVREEEFVPSVRGGSPLAFAELYRLYSPRLYNTILRITKNPEDAEDTLQETFLRVHRAIHAFEGRSSVYSWLTRIAMNSALRTLRRRRARAEILFDPYQNGHIETGCLEFRDSAPSPEQLCDLTMRRLRLTREICMLDESLRGPIRMQIINGATVKQIGQTFDLSEMAVKVRLHRARLRLYAAFQGGQRQRRAPFQSIIAPTRGQHKRGESRHSAHCEAPAYR